MDYSSTDVFTNIFDTPEIVNETYLGDTNYFKMDFVESEFAKIKDIEDPKEKSKKVAKLLYDVIQNVSATCCKTVHMKELYLSNYKYNHVILKAYDKYSEYVEEADKDKIRKAIDSAFKGDWRDNLVKGAVSLVTDLMVPREFEVFKNLMKEYAVEGAKNVYNAIFDKMGVDIANKAAFAYRDLTMDIVYPYLNDLLRGVPKDAIAGVFFSICPPKFQNIATALTVYKKSSQSGVFKSEHTIKGAKYCFDVTSKVMEDIIKLYRKL